MRVLYPLWRILVVFVCVAFFSFGASAQEQEPPKVDHSYKPLTLKLSEDGKKYVRFIMWHQLWLTSQNFDTQDKFQITPSIRRSRFLAFSQISPRFLILTHFGLNGLSPSNMTTLGSNGDSPKCEYP